MKREIKLRAWDKEINQMRDCDGMILNHIYLAPSGVGFVDKDLIQLKNYIPMQFTGLRDKSDKEIYEGDIISVSNNGAFIGNCEIIWKGCGFWFKDVDFTSETYENLFVYDQCGYGLEVIGNIYENPKLLTEVEND